MEDKALRFLGLARRARLLEVGEEPVGIACRAGHARLLLIAQDAADHTFRRARSFCRSGKPPPGLQDHPAPFPAHPAFRSWREYCGRLLRCQ